MRLLELLFPSAKSRASIAKTEDASQISLKRIKEPLTSTFFLPNMSEKQTIKLWASYIAFYSLVSIVTLLTFTHDISLIIRHSIETVVITSLVVTGEMVFLANSAKKFREFNWRSKQITAYLLSTSFIIVPVLSLLGRLILFFTLGYEVSLNTLILETLVNTLCAFLMIAVLLTFFEIQYQNIRRAELRTQQKLIEQNEQLKARITPHFFFNLLNTMQYLIETDAYEAERMICHISNLYRVSFDETREIALLDEMELCESYLSIEKYRFDKKLKVTWHLPDEDLLYDMVITSLSLQIVIEKLIVLIVENSTDPIHIIISIDWQNDVAKIDIEIELPATTYQLICQDIRQKLQFNSQVAILRQYFGHEASIHFELSGQLLITQIRYPLKDVAAF